MKELLLKSIKSHYWYDRPREAREKGVHPYFRVIESEQDTEVIMNGKKVLMFGSNSYLGLTNDKRVINSAKEAIDNYGTGCAGSRFLNGTLDVHVNLEKRLAKFLKKEDVIVFSTGFQVNTGVIPSILSKSDYIIIDELVHACIIEGTRLSFAKTLKFKHNDMESLEKKLQLCDPNRAKLIIVDGVYSMEGDIAKVPEIVALSEKYNASVMIDDAHGLGVLGDHGRGTAFHFGLENKIDLMMGTFSKSFATTGGFIAGDADVIDFIRHNARSLLFSASLTPACVASALKVLDIIETDNTLMKKLWVNTNFFINELKNRGLEIGHTASPIIPVYIRDYDKTFIFTKRILEEGVFVNPVIPPAVSPDSTLIRLSVMASHTKEQLEFAINKIEKVAKELNIIQFVEK